MRNRNWYGVTIQVRRGTKAQLDGITLAAGELGFTTDDQTELWIGTGAANLLVGRVLSGAVGSIPAAAVTGRLYFATDTDELFFDNGATWDEIISDIGGTQDNLVKIDANGKPTDAGVAVDDAGATTADLWTAQKITTEINNAINGRKWKNPAAVLNLVGNGAALTIEGLTPTAGDAYVVTTANGAGDLATATVGDIWEYSGSAWAKVITGSGGYVPDGTRAVLSTTTALIAPYTDATDDGKIVSFDGTTNTGTDTSEAADGSALLISGENSIYENDAYAFDGAVPTGTWVLMNAGGGLTAGNGITISSSIISVKPDVTTGGNIVALDVVANGVGLDVSDIAGTGIEADGSGNLRLAAQGNGIAGGAGSTLSVAADSTTGVTVAPVAVGGNGVGVTVDNSSIKHTAGSLYVNLVDGGSFV